ncbi:MAG: DUF418 domain-containing protein [Geminicoccaceae bacterium]|nr:DUF418 domain-containing protein [Geminicoccaceae bacterium]
MASTTRSSESAPDEGARPAQGGRGGSASQRLVVVDAVRALALFGVLVMNLHDQSGLEYLSENALAAVQGPFDRLLDVALEVLVDKKFLSAFSFLFGLSFTLLLAGKDAYQLSFLLMYGRRLLGLAAFGLLNVAFLYWGDILLTYAALGALLILFVRLPGPLVLTCSAVLILGAPLLLAILGAAPAEDVQTDLDLAALAAFSSPSWLQSTTFGIERYFGHAGSSSLYDNWDNINIFGLFLLGLWVGRKDIPWDLGAWRPLLRKVALIGLPIGVAASVAEVLLPRASPLATAMLFGTPVLAIGYIASAALLLDRPSARPLAALLAAPGRLALTNYLSYGLIGQIAFYGWALGWLGHVGTAGVLVIALIGYLLMLAFSRAWLTRFTMGPAEWLWRCFTKLEVPPIRRPAAA